MFNKNKQPDLSDMSRLSPEAIRSWERSNKATGRRAPVMEVIKARVPSKEAVFAGAAATVAVLGAGMMKEGDLAQRDAVTDAHNQEQVIEDNPEIFDHSTVNVDIYETGVSDATEPYRVEPGDNAWNMGERVEANVDGIAGNQDVRPFVDDIQAQAGEDGVFQIGDTVQVPAGSDRHQDPGVQLSSK